MSKHQPEDTSDLPNYLQPRTLTEKLSTVHRNLRRQYRREREFNKPLVDWDTPPEFRDPSCMTCKDARHVIIGHAGYQTLYGLCPACGPLIEQERRDAINRRWPLSSWEESLAGAVWFDEWHGARSAEGAKAARAAQGAIMAEMPSATTLLLYGPPGTGKTRLILEIVTAARATGLAAIYRSGERLRTILQNFPHDSDEPGTRAHKERRLEIARADLVTADVLAIDEIDDISGPSIRKTILEIVNARIAAGLTTVAAGNNIAELTPPLLSRFRASNNLAVDLTGDDDARVLVGHGANGAAE